MSNLYPGTAVAGYNSNPPPDDGSQVSTNLITWAGIKSKVGDPLNTFAGAVDSNLTAAFGKTLDGASVVKTAVSYAMTAADQGRLIVATASGITITTPDAGTVGAPFIFEINNQSGGQITLAGNATNAQTVDGATTQPIANGAGCFVKTDGTNWFTSGLNSPQIGSVPYGFDTPINLKLVASVASNLLTIAVKSAVTGNDPSAGDAVKFIFRDVTIANGDPVTINQTAALSISTNATGATLGTQSGNVPFRLWILAFNNAGTVELALWHSGAGAASFAINPLNEAALQSTTGIGSGATSAGVFYTPNGVTLTNCAFRIIGYLDYTSGLTTAGTYATAPTRLQLFGPGIARPGQTIQTVVATSSSSTTITSTTSNTATNLAGTITPTTAVNPIKARADAYMTLNANVVAAKSSTIAQMYRGGAGGTAVGTPQVEFISSSAGGAVVNLPAWDLPGAGASTYTVCIKNLTANNWGNVFLDQSQQSGQGMITLEEIQA